ncbi:MAG: AAA family ATPase [Candidatus Dormibacteria bacterium]
MRDDELRTRLRQLNPWWAAAAGGIAPTAWAETDPTLLARRPFDLGYRSRVLDDVGGGPPDDRLIILRGPRRVGKSVALKDTVFQLCSRPEIDCRQIIYVAADGFRKLDINRAVTLGRELTRAVDPAPRIWLFDEITSVSGWTETVKYLRDQTPFGMDTVVCTGSSWDADAKIERDLFAGRAGIASSRRSRLLLPLSFRDYVVATRRHISPPRRLAPWDLQSPAAKASAEALDFFVDELDLAWQSYLTSGGFPRAVAEHHRDGRVSESFLRDVAAALHRDVDPAAPADSVPLLLAELTRRSTSPLNKSDAAEALGYVNRKTFELRLHRLVSAFAAVWCHQVDGAGRRVAGAQSKLYLLDPLLSWMGSLLRSGVADPDFTQMSEGAIALCIARAVDEYQEDRWMADDSVGYLRTQSGEIDFAPVSVPTAANAMMTTPIESKWVSTGWRGEAQALEKRFGGGVMATKSIMNFDHPAWAIPAPIVALLLG